MNMYIQIFIACGILLQGFVTYSLPTPLEKSFRNDENMLRTVDKLIQGLSGTKRSVLGEEWRTEDGELQDSVVADTITKGNPLVPSPCVSKTSGIQASAIGTLKSNDIVLKYNYYPLLTDYPSMVSNSHYFDNVCVYVEVDLDAVYMNTNSSGKVVAPTIPLKVPVGGKGIIKGLTCNNCVATVGARLEIAIACSLTTKPISCGVAFNASGGVSYHFELELNNPVVSTGNAPVVIDLLQGSSFNIFSNTDVNLSIQPTLHALISGNVSGTGKTILQSSFHTTDSFGISSQLSFSDSFNPAGDAVYGIKANTVLQNPNIVASNLVLQNPSNFHASITPSVVWSLGYGKTVSSIGLYAGSQIVSDFLTSLTGTFDFATTQTGAFSSNTTLTADMSFQSMTAYTMLGCTSNTPSSTNAVCGHFPLISAPYPNPPQKTVLYHHADSLSLTVSYSNPDSPSSNSNSNGSSLSTNGIIAIVVVMVVVVPALILAIYFMACKNGSTRSPAAAAKASKTAPVWLSDDDTAPRKPSAIRKSELSPVPRSSYAKQTAEML